MTDDFFEDDILDLPEEDNSTPPLGPGKLPTKAISPRQMVQSVMRVYNELGAEQWLLEQARDNPREFLQMLKTLLPKDASEISSDNKINIVIAAAPGHEKAPNRAEVIDLSTPELDQSSPEHEAINVKFLQ